MAGMEEINEQGAVEVKGAHWSYGSLSVLKGLDMDVPYSCIYGLLGASGCGKTTLLHCILGRLRLSKGSVRVLGLPPGTRGHTIPGRDVGYMPQDLALLGDFTMLETMYYFGTLHRMSPRKVRERGQFLLKLLELPSAVCTTIKSLSSGQQRRVSFAVAMLQEPPLLILDEPTVGVDPLLRAKIWQHLLELIERTRTTIIITTHYIEEARKAHVVGLMRNGRLLTQSPPNDLISAQGTTTLEEVFLKFCHNQDANNQPDIYTSTPLEEKEARKDDEESMSLLKPKAPRNDTWTNKMKKRFMSVCEFNPSTVIPHPRNIIALSWKNLTRIYRNPGILLMQFLISSILVAMFCLAIGRNFSGLNVAIVNNDKGDNLTFLLDKYCSSFNDMTNNFGSFFVSKLDHKLLDMIYYDNMMDAVDAVKKGHAWMALVIPENFTRDTVERLILTAEGQNVPVDTINGSTAMIYADVTNLQITYTLQNTTKATAEHFLEAIFNNCNISQKDLSSPIQIHDPPVYGNLHLSYTDYVVPGTIAIITFSASINLVSLSFVMERKEGLLDRTWVAGVNVTEMVLAQMLTQCIILFVQSTAMILLVVFAFRVYMVHLISIFLVELLAMLQGLAGMAYGLFISSLCKQEQAAWQIASTSNIVLLVISGIIWPVEGMPKFLRYISYALPTTHAAEAMRSIIGRGWGLGHLVVWRGFTITIGWFMLFGILAIIGLRLRK